MTSSKLQTITKQQQIKILFQKTLKYQIIKTKNT